MGRNAVTFHFALKAAAFAVASCYAAVGLALPQSSLLAVDRPVAGEESRGARTEFPNVGPQPQSESIVASEGEMNLRLATAFAPSAGSRFGARPEGARLERQRPEVLIGPGPSGGIVVSANAAARGANIFGALVRSSEKSANTVVVENGRMLLRYVDPVLLARREPAPAPVEPAAPAAVEPAALDSAEADPLDLRIEPQLATSVEDDFRTVLAETAAFPDEESRIAAAGETDPRLPAPVSENSKNTALAAARPRYADFAVPEIALIGEADAQFAPEEGVASAAFDDASLQFVLVDTAALSADPATPDLGSDGVPAQPALFQTRDSLAVHAEPAAALRPDAPAAAIEPSAQATSAVAVFADVASLNAIALAPFKSRPLTLDQALSFVNDLFDDPALHATEWTMRPRERDAATLDAAPLRVHGEVAIKRRRKA